MRVERCRRFRRLASFGAVGFFWLPGLAQLLAAALGEEEALGAARRWAEAFAGKDIAAIEALFSKSPSSTYISSTRPELLRGREPILAHHRSIFREFESIRLTLEDLKEHIFPGGAVVVGRYRFAGRLGDRTSEEWGRVTFVLQEERMDEEEPAPRRRGEERLVYRLLHCHFSVFPGR